MTDKDDPESSGASQNNSEGKDQSGSQDKDDIWISGPEVSQQTNAGQSNTGKKWAIFGDHKGKKENMSDENKSEWERDVLNRLAFASLNEQRRARRWGIFFKSLVFVYIFVIFFYIPSGWDTGKITPGKHTALVDLEGVISAESPANADALVGGLREAFKHKNTAAVILLINSP